MLNHGLFKGLLFLNAGSMLHATGTQDLNQMGGMMKFMPLTAITALIASFSISGVPLFNGFVSKWSIYVAAIQGSGSAHYLVVCAVIAILTSALTLASFIKFFGVSFLSRTSALVRERAAKGRLEVPWMMQVPQLALAFCCVLLGVVPAIGFRLIAPRARSQPRRTRNSSGECIPNAEPAAGGTRGTRFGRSVRAAGSRARAGAHVPAGLRISKLGGATRRAAAPWLCGYAREAECNRYVAHNFYGEIKRYFRWLGGMPRSAQTASPEGAAMIAREMFEEFKARFGPLIDRADIAERSPPLRLCRPHGRTLRLPAHFPRTRCPLCCQHRQR